MINKKNNLIKPIRQEDFKNFSKFPRHSIVEVLRTLTDTERRLLDLLMKLSQKHEYVYYSQSSLAEMLGCSRMTISRCLRTLESLGFIHSHYRHRHSCIYRPHPFFFLQDIRERVQHLLPSLFKVAFLFLILATSFVKADKHWRVTPLIQGYKDLSIRPCMSNDVYGVTGRAIRGEGIIRMGVERSSEMPFADVEFMTTQLARASRDLRLARAGQIKLSAFSEDTLRYMLDQWANRKELVRKPFQWAMKVCVDYCDREGLEPRWDRMRALQGYYSIPVEAHYTLPETCVEDDAAFAFGHKLPEPPAPQLTIPKTGMRVAVGHDVSQSDSTVIESKDWDGKPYRLITGNKSWEREQAKKFREESRRKYGTPDLSATVETNGFRRILEDLIGRSTDDRADDSDGSGGEL
jgi:predicted transcriptional regulator